MDFNFPVRNAVCVSSFPPTCWPFTKTFGTVCCPVMLASVCWILDPSGIRSNSWIFTSFVNFPSAKRDLVLEQNPVWSFFLTCYYYSFVRILIFHAVSSHPSTSFLRSFRENSPQYVLLKITTWWEAISLSMKAFASGSMALEVEELLPIVFYLWSVLERWKEGFRKLTVNLPLWCVCVFLCVYVSAMLSINIPGLTWHRLPGLPFTVVRLHQQLVTPTLKLVEKHRRQHSKSKSSTGICSQSFHSVQQKRSQPHHHDSCQHSDDVRRSSPFALFRSNLFLRGIQ